MNALMFRADGIDNQGLGFEAGFIGDAEDNLSFSLDDLYAILGDDSDPSINHSPCSQEDLQCQNFLEGDLNPVSVKHEEPSQSQDGIRENLGAPPVEASLLGSCPWYPSSDYKTPMQEDFFESSGKGSFSEIYSSFLSDYEKLDNLPQFDNKFPFSGLYQESDWLTLSSSEHDTCSRDSAGGSVDALIASSIDNHHLHNDIPNCSIKFPSDVNAGEANHFSDCKDGTILVHFDSGKGKESRQMTNGSPFQLNVKKEFASDINFASVPPNSILQNNRRGSSHPMLMEKSALTIGKYENMDTSSMGALEGDLHTFPKTEHFTDADPSLSGTVNVEANIGQVSEIMHEDNDDCSLMHFCRDTTTNADGGRFADNITNQFSPSTYIQQFMPSNSETMIHVKDESEDHLIEPPSMCRASEINSLSQLHIIDADLSLPGLPCAELNTCQDMNFKSESSGHCLPASFSRISATDADDAPFTDIDSKKFLPGIQPFNSSQKRQNCIKDERDNQLLTSRSTCHSVKVIEEAVQKNPLGDSSNVDNDADICILEALSDPGHAPLSVVHVKSYSTTQRSTFNDPLHHPGIGGTRFRSNDERLTFQAALQNLSQTKSEATPPDGFLAVPLLRHQRIALAWMVQKETSSLHCSGGILADDQGLGKTVSTIALILMERAPISKLSSKAMELGEVEALDLDDDDDDEVLELNGMKQSRNSDHFMMNKTSMKGDNAFVAGKARPAAGTLVVCPTSVLRQWAEELHNKVTGKANVSVLVYHGSNRTKDPAELAKYDVVLTTYSIVSMEVPKQPLVDQDDEEKGNPEGHDFPMGPSTSRKRKYPPSSSKKSLKDKKGIDGALLESVGRPLARVGWFRVVLDEAQSIKNHRTQVARACWGLRAKRRWCLSGTPIQNAVDDLYSYFRFLRYDPYAVYKSFCSTIKIPINRNPTNGYKKLQAVLKTIMLRRTKATLIDGEPIINLPPKTISLKKVEFSDEERAFYSKLEADSRDQFKVYAAAGTVKQNYVNILLMLLRLRQACDHPLLVKGYNSNSVWKSSFETAKKLPMEKQRNLLNCLEACLAICGICNDPPEDAVVTICGHVFCNQCICEHLTGDENLCPAAQCKVQLSVTSVFSKATLKSSLSEQPGHDFASDKSRTKLIESPELCAESMSSDSSKIRAALEILQSLSKSQYSNLKSCSVKCDDGVSCQENISDSVSEGASKDVHDKSHLDREKGIIVQVGEKAIVFSQWTRMLDLLEVPLRNSSIQYRRLDGTMSVMARDKAVKDFNTLPEVSVMIMSLKAASLGLNMVAACHVLLLDLWWNPTTEDQAIDRAHRIGQTRPVTVSRLTVKDTVEDRILALQQKKREMVASAFGEDETGGRQTRLTVDDLKYLFMV